MNKLLTSFFIIFILILIPLTACSKAAEKTGDETAENASKSLNETKAGEKIQEQPKAPVQPEVKEEPVKNASVQAEQPAAPKQEELVRIVGVSVDGRSCILSIKGQTTVIDEGKSATIQGVTVRVTEVVAMHSVSGASDQCKISIS